MALKRPLIVAFVLALGGCATDIKTTPGLTALEAGRDEEAFRLLSEESAAGRREAKYGLGVAYMEGRGVAADPAHGEVLITEAALATDPRAASYLARLYKEHPLCEKDRVLARSWNTMSVMYRNLVSGIIEVFLAPPVMQREMASIYLDPCPGRPRQPEAAALLTRWSKTGRTTVIMFPAVR